MNDRGQVSNLGIFVYGAAGILLGLVGLVSGNFAVTWQHVGPNVPLRQPLAYAAALVELTAGVAVIVPRTARIGAAVLTMIYTIFTLLWVPKALVDIVGIHYDAMGNVFEEFAMVLGGLVLYAALTKTGSFWSRREALWGRLMGICSISFGIVQIFDTMPGLTGFIPKWLPPNQLFWAYATTVSFFLAAAAILSGIMAPLATRLLTAEIIGFQFLVWIPRIVAAPRDHGNWGGNGINLAIAGAVWVVADSTVRLAAARSTGTKADSAGVA